MKKSLVLLLVLAVMAMAGVLVACGEEATTDGGGDTGGATGEVALSVLDNPQGYPADPSMTPETGGTMNMILGMTLTNFGAPWSHMPGPNAYACRMVCEPLVTIGSDGSRAACLATDWVKDADAMTYTLTLREGVKFQDGTDFNAEAVKWNLEKAQAEGAGALKNVTSVEAIDDYTVVITLSVWDEILLEALGDQGMQVSPTAYEEYGDDIATHPVGTGPFMFSAFSPDVSIDLVANPDYWQEGLPYLDGVHIDMVLDSDVRFGSFLAGDCDYLEGASGTQVAQAEDEGFTALFMVSGVMGMTWDSTSPESPFSDINVRKAIAMACPYDTIIEDAYSMMYPTTNQFAAKIDGRELQAWNNDIVGYEYDEATALQMLTDAGYGLDNPIECKFVYNTNPENDDLMTAIQADLAKVGVNITLEGLDHDGWAAYATTQGVGEMCSLQTSYQLPLPYVSTLAEALSKGSSWYPLQYVSDEYDAVYQTMLAENDPDAKEALYEELNKIAVDGCFALPQYLRTNYKLVGKNLHDMGAGQWSGEFDPSIVWLSK